MNLLTVWGVCCSEKEKTQPQPSGSSQAQVLKQVKAPYHLTLQK